MIIEKIKIKPQRFLVLCLIIIQTIILYACQSPTPTQPTQIDFNTATQTSDTLTFTQTLSAYETLVAGFTQTAQVTPTPRPTSTLTRTPIPPTRTSTPTALPTIGFCNWAQFVNDITIPDGSEIPAGASFRKIWRLKNLGTCQWTADYALVFVGGQSFNAPLRTRFGETVRPGESVTVSVQLEAPISPENYTGYFMLEDDEGERFGVGADANESIWVNIVVSPADQIIYNFVNNYCEAAWQSGTTVPLPCPGDETAQNSGFVVRKDNPRREDGAVENEPGLITSPDDADRGYIFGIFPAIDIEEGDLFRSVIGCEYDNPGCNLIFELRYQISGGRIRTLANWHEVYDAQYRSINVNLSDLAGYRVNFILYIENNGTALNNRGLWLMPRIMR